MKLSVYSLKNVLFQGEARVLSCNTPLGEITVLDNHQTLIATLSFGVIKIVDSAGKEYFFEIKSGFLEVKENNEARCIVN